MTVSPREQSPTLRGRQTQAAIDNAARAVIARKGFLATTISDIATEAGQSTASFHNYYDSKESMVRGWAQRFLDDARAAGGPGDRLAATIKRAQREGYCVDDKETAAT